MNNVIIDSAIASADAFVHTIPSGLVVFLIIVLAVSTRALSFRVKQLNKVVYDLRKELKRIMPSSDSPNDEPKVHSNNKQ